MSLTGALTGEPKEVIKVEHRFAGLSWGEKNGLALLRDYDRDRRWSKTYALSFDDPVTSRLIWKRSLRTRKASAKSHWAAISTSRRSISSEFSI